MNEAQFDLALWVMWVSGTIVVICALALIVMRVARQDLPPNPTLFERLQHTLWNNL